MSNSKKQFDFYIDLFEGHFMERTPHEWYFVLDEALCNIEYNYYHSKTNYIKTKQLRKIIKELGEAHDEYHKNQNRNQAEDQLLNSLTEQAKKIKNLIKNEIKIAPEPYNSWLKALKSTCNHIVNLKDNIHHCICKEMFASVFHGEKVYVYIDNYDATPSDDKQYMSAFINATSKVREPVEYLHCSVVSEKMLEYDKLMFSEILENNNSEEKVNYKPYFMEFVIPVDRNGNTKGYYNKNDVLQDINSENGWFEARFVPNSDEDSCINGSYVEGGMLTFASPADYISGKLVFQNPAFKRTSKALRADIEGVYNIIQERETDEINKLLEDHILNIKWANVYNIGHGNFITLNDDNDNTKAIYDIGLPYAFPISKSPRIMKQDYKAVYNEMKNIKAEIVIISHWDSDHYIGAYENEQDIFDIPWIVTECNPKGQINAKRIMAYLYCKKNINYRNNLFLYKGNPTNTQLAFAEYDDNKSYKFQLYKGHGTSPMITPINCQGIAVRISINDVSTLMCGDIPYDCLSDNIINDNVYEYVVIPHHASNMDQKSYDALAKINSIKYPIICVNNKEKLGKTKTAVENGEHCDKIKKKSGNKVFFTDNNTHSLKKYELDLSSQNSLTQI